MKPLRVAILCALLALPALSADVRTWTSISGITIDAAFLSLHGRSVTLAKADGSTIRIALHKLASSDQARVRALHEAELRAKGGAFRNGRDERQTPPSASQSQFPDQIVAETNLARTDPAGYAKHVRDFARTHEGDGVFSMPGVGRIRTQEGMRAVNEAIAFLEKAEPVRALSGSDVLSSAAQDHTNDIGPKGITGHGGSDKSTPAERVHRHGVWQGTVGENIAFGPVSARSVVVQLIIDDGVPDRGHRTNIFSPDYKVLGAAKGAHLNYGTVCVINYAGGIRGE